MAFSFLVAVMLLQACDLKEKNKSLEDFGYTNLCDIPEDEHQLETIMLQVLGNNMSESDITSLKEMFLPKRPYTVIDSFRFDEHENYFDKVRFIRLSKFCTGLDNVPYVFSVLLNIAKDGSILSSDYLLIHKIEDLIAKKRKIQSLKAISLSNTKFQSLFKSQLTGRKRKDIDKYLISIGAQSLGNNSSNVYRYTYNPSKNLSERSLSKFKGFLIKVSYNQLSSFQAVEVISIQKSGENNG